MRLGSSWVQAPGARARRGQLEALLLDRVLRRPIVYQDMRGLRYVLYPGENAGVYLEHGGNYEVAETAFCEDVLAPGMTAFDVGANMGLYTLLMAKLVGQTGIVHSFEPEPDNFGRLGVNVALNGCANVKARQTAVFSASGRRPLSVYERRLNAWHSLGAPALADPFRPGALATPVTTVEVETVALDDYCREEEVARIDVLKIDVEGAELDVLRGARGLLESGRIDLILFEVSVPQVLSLGHRPDDIFTYLATFGFTCSPLGHARAPGAGPTSPYGNYVACRGEAHAPAAP